MVPETTTEADTSQQTEGVRDAAEQDVELGLSGYQRFQERLAHAISPVEAEQAEHEFRKGMRLLAATIASIVLLQTVNLLLPFGPAVRLRVETGIEVLGYLAALFLVSAARVPFAVTAILPFITVMALGVMPIDGIWSEAWMGGVLLFVALVAMGSAAALDYGASTEPTRTRPRVRKWTLVALGLVSFVIVRLLRLLGPQADAGLIGYLFGATILVWAFVVLPIFEKRQRLPLDVETLLGAAFRRWRRFALGRALALVFGVFPFFLFLNAIGIHERLSPAATSVGSDDGRMLVRTRAGDAEGVWFSQTKGRLLDARDFARDDVVVHRVTVDDRASLATLKDGCVPGLTGIAQRFCAVHEAERDMPPGGAVAFAFLLDSSTLPGTTWTFNDGDAAARLAEIFGPPIRTPEEFRRLWDDGKWSGAFVIERHPALPTPAKPDRNEIVYAQKAMLSQALTADVAGRVATVALLVSVLLLGCGAMGFVLLWQRGGDSPVGRWLGLWFVGLAAVPFYALSDFFLPALKYTLWHEALVSPMSAVLLFLSLTLEFFTFCFEQPHAVLLPLAALWVHVVWPPPSEGRSVWRRTLSASWRIGLVSTLVILIAVAITSAIERVADDGAASEIAAGVVEVVVIGGLLLVVTRWLRRRAGGAASEAVFGSLAVAALFVGALGLAILTPAMPGWFTIGQPFFRSTALWYAFGAGYVLMAASVVLFGYLFVRRNLLRAISTKDMSNFFFVLILPFLFEVGDNVAAAALRQTSFFSERGADLLGVFGVVLFLGPLWALVHRFVRVAAHPKLRTIEQGVADVLEQVVGCETDVERQATVSALLGRLGVDGYLLYVRRKNDSFEVISSAPGAPAAAHLSISRHLREYFRHNAGFLDLSTAPFEWRLFFHQFELKRLVEATNARYVLPIGLGSSLRGLLFVADGPAGSDVCRDTLAKDFGNVGLAVTRT